MPALSTIGTMAALTRLMISLVAAVVIGWVLFIASVSIAGPSGAFCFDPTGRLPPDRGCVHVSIDPITGRGVSNHETSRTDAAGDVTWYHQGTAVTGPIAIPMLVTVPILTTALYLILGAIERRGAAASPDPATRRGPEPRGL
jgi:hypothetical protein